MRNKFWEKRIPTLLGIFLIILGFGITFYLGNKKIISVVNKINPKEEPQKVRITNVSDSSFSVSYSTIETVTGSLNLGADKNSAQTILDDRDQGVSKPHKLHYVTVKNLSPSTTYFFTINSGQNVYNNSGENFKATTGPLLNINSSVQKPANGKITTSKGTIPQEAIIYLTAVDAQAVSALIGSGGSFIIPLNSLRNSNTLAYFNFTNNSVLKILAVSESEKSNVSIKINQIYPIPTIILSRDYDFTQVQNNVSTQSAPLIIPTSSPTSTPSSQSSQVLASETSIVITPTITSTPTPTFSPSITSSQTPTIAPTLPASGNPIIIATGILGMIVTVVGGLLFLFTRGGKSSL